MVMLALAPWALLSPLGVHFKQVLALSSFDQALLVAVPVVVGALADMRPDRCRCASCEAC